MSVGRLRGSGESGEGKKSGKVFGGEQGGEQGQRRGRTLTAEKRLPEHRRSSRTKWQTVIASACPLCVFSAFEGGGGTHTSLGSDIAAAHDQVVIERVAGVVRALLATVPTVNLALENMVSERPQVLNISCSVPLLVPLSPPPLTPSLSLLVPSARWLARSSPLALTQIRRSICHQPWSLRTLARILDAVDDPRLLVCVDICHAYIAEFDLAATGLVDMLDVLALEVGWHRVAGVHVSDSATPHGRRCEGHAK